MPVSKYVAIRHRVIDQLIGNKYKPFPSKMDLLNACEEALFGETFGEVSERTIEKDIKDMKMEYDAPIKYSKGNEGYYYEEEGFSIDLNSSQVEAIKMAANILSQFRNTEVFKDFDSAIDKILDRVSISNDSPNQSIDQYVQFEKAPKVLGTEFLNPILQAIKSKQPIQFEHQKFEHAETKIREINPYLLKEYRNRWYVIGLETKTNIVKTFGLDRVLSVSVLDKVFSSVSFDVEGFFKNNIGITIGASLPEKVQLELSPLEAKYAISQPFHHSQKTVLQTKEKTIVELFVVITKELEMKIHSMGSGIKVLAPSSLVDAIKKDLKKSLSNYDIN